MSINKRYLPPFEKVEADYEKLSLDDFVRSYGKAEVWIGDPRAIKLIESALEKKNTKK